ncbi:hypothetical protein [Xylophilus sp. GOD-11R]|uniref:hypothetical protein n=1 Tax=Xylophilus sp. GOD-11R TaxID=3089814 RepID=UPI00298CBF54|nr:hypothetical protein [Xylophilus sp. GOD-11R]WPB56636.1 hypothetical protein R9X41_21245 [Xylophilus sp. GOD-11R]
MKRFIDSLQQTLNALSMGASIRSLSFPYAAMSTLPRDLEAEFNNLDSSIKSLGTAMEDRDWLAIQILLSLVRTAAHMLGNSFENLGSRLTEIFYLLRRFMSLTQRPTGCMRIMKKPARISSKKSYSARLTYSQHCSEKL